MARLTKSEIEDRLLRGEEIEWRDASKKKQKLALKTARARRLFHFLLASSIRKPTELPVDFVAGLFSTSQADNDPADNVSEGFQDGSTSSWHLQSIETVDIGGVNTWNGPTFTYEFDGESWLAQGPNGSGKSSLIGAMIWAMTSTRPRDHIEMAADAVQPVYSLVGNDRTEKQIGQWPTLVALPQDAVGLATVPKASVTMVFQNSAGKVASVSRTLDNGCTLENRPPYFSPPPILIETGLVMPARLSSMKFGEGRSPLAEAVQRLTGLDDLIAIGQLCDGLCNKGREYLTYRKKELAKLIEDFDQALTAAGIELKKVDRRVPDFLPGDTSKEDGDFAKLGKELTTKSAELIEVMSGDLAEDIDLTLPAVQQSVVVAIAAAKEDVARGMQALPFWQQHELLLAEVDEVLVEKIEAAIATAKRNGEEALLMLSRSEDDDRFRLKAMAAAWHASHAASEVERCPLCLELIQSTALKQELEALRLAGDAASRTFADNCLAIVDQLSTSLPAKLRNFGTGEFKTSPRNELSSILQDTFTANPKYAGTLVAFGKLVDGAMNSVPILELEDTPLEQIDPRLATVFDKIYAAERLLRRRWWFIQAKAEWENWWAGLVAVPEAVEISSEANDRPGVKSPESWTAHLNRLTEATVEAEPYRLGAASLRKAWTYGKAAREIEVELAVRQEVADAIDPLKSLGSLGESVVREAILGLSDRMETILDKTLVSDKVQFQEAKFNKKEGITIRGAVSDNILIDATSVANTSWLRAVLWAFIFALREEAVEQAGHDAFPLMVLDDPQTTFDDQHRHRWSQQIASLQNGPGRVQIVLVTHDQNFVELIRVSGVSGRLALLSSAGDDIGHISVYDGVQLDKLWEQAKVSKSSIDAQTYLRAARVQVETILRVMLRGEEAGVNAVGKGFVVGASRAKLEWLNDKERAPWDKNPTQKLIKALNQDHPAIKHLEVSSHAGSVRLGFAEATDVQAHLSKTLSPALDDVFRGQREHFRLHGGMTRLHTPATVLPWPDGFDAEVRQIQLRILGRAAALTNGRYADGCIEMDDFDETTAKKITLAQHAAYRLTARTLEPVAEKGDILIVKKGATATTNSLVVASTDRKLFARRLEFAENHSDISVLIAQANNPRVIVAPVIAQKSTFDLQKIVGVIYDRGFHTSDGSGNEILVLDGAAALTSLTSASLGLVGIDGTSAEPIALNEQYIIVSAPVASSANMSALVGKPVIVEDKGGARYFKRLQITDRGIVVLESLDASGEHGPIIMKTEADDRSDDNVISRVWPVAGILFELPN